MQINDNHICKLLNEHDHRGMEILFNNYYRPLVLWADTFLNDVAISEDIVQELLMSFWEQKIYKRITPAKLRGYIFTSVKNKSLKYLERDNHQRKVRLTDTLFTELLDPDSLTEEMLQALNDEIEKLPQRTRDVLKSIYVDGMRYKETAEKFSISIDTVKTLLASALKKLRAALARFKIFFQ